MSKRPTLKDVARQAGVSIATVNRVVAAAPGVRADTAQKVSDAAAAVGYYGRNLIAQNVLRNVPHLTLGVVLQKQRQAFYAAFAQALQQAAAAETGARITVEIVYATSHAPKEVAGLIASLKDRVDVVAAAAVNHGVIAGVVKELADADVPVIALLSDFAQDDRAGYYGLNNLKVGRGTAHMLGLAARQPGKVGLFVGGNRWHGHELRETGFRSQFRETAAGFHVLDTLFNLETRQLTYEATLVLLARHPDLVGMYLAGGGMEGAIAALREERGPGDVALVVNELTPDSRRAMADGYVTMIMGTPLDALCAELMTDIVQLRNDPDFVMGQRFFDPVIFLPEFF